MIAEERDIGGGGQDGGLKLGAGLGGILLDPQPESAFGDRSVRDGARPVARVQATDGEWVRDRVARHLRLDGLVAAYFERGQGGMDRQVVIDGGRPGVPGAAVRREPGHLDPEGQGAGIGGDQVEIGRLGDEAAPAGVSALQSGERPDPTILLTDHEVHGERR